MSPSSPANAAQPRRSALKTESESERTPPLNATVKAVQIAEPESSSPDEAQVKRQFSAGVAKRLSGRPPVSTAPSRSSTLSQVSIEGGLDANTAPSSASAEDLHERQPRSRHRHRLDIATERLLAQVADWLHREKIKKEHKKSRKHHVRRRTSPDHVSIPVPPPQRPRTDSFASDSSEVSLDRLQRILDDSMAALGLSSTPSFGPRLSKRHRRRSSKTLSRAASSDTEWFDGDVVVPSCDSFLDNSKTLSYTGGKAGGADDSASISSRKEEKERQHWLTFKNEIIRLAHTLRLKGWRRVPLDGGEVISVERLSGALTNAVYVVSPPPESLLPREAGKKQPGKVLLRIYGPQVEHLIDRENELGVLKRLARKKIGPRLLGTFLNGRFEQYLNATALTPSSMREPETSKQIAKRMRELHDGVELLEEERDQGPGVWKNWDRWLSQVEKTVLFLDRLVLVNSPSLPGGVWKTRGFVCGVQWHVFKGLVDKYRRHLDVHYGGAERLRDKLVFAHNDTQYGNILRVRPDDQKSPLLQPANEHKQLVVIDFEYAAANPPGLEFANHFSEWTYNYHDPVQPYACDTSRYPTPDQQRRFVKAYVDHRPQLPYPEAAAAAVAAAASPSVTPLSTPGSTSASNSAFGTPSGRREKAANANATATGFASAPAPTPPPPLHTTPSSSSIVEFMLDARVPPGGWKEEERRREEEAERRVRELLEETRLWRVANSAQWVAWGIVQAKIEGVEVLGEEQDEKLNNGVPTAGEEEPLESTGGEGTAEDADKNADASADAAPAPAEDEFDYLAYAQERAYFFLGDCVLMGLVTPEELGEEVSARLKLVDY